MTKIKYPATDTDNGETIGQPSDETYDRIVFAYNVDGTLASRTDQNGTVLSWKQHFNDRWLPLCTTQVRSAFTHHFT
ncbi:MAG: hypothetical protein V2A79_15065 [Planctomycetota bacterium]